MIGDARRAEIIGLAAHREHQRVVAQAPSGHHQPPVRREQRCDLDLARVAIEPLQPSGLIGEAGVMRLRDIAGLLLRQVARPGRDGMQHRLPHMRGFAVHQRDREPVVPTPLAPTQRRGDLQSRDATADDDDLLPILMFHGAPFLPVNGAQAGARAPSVTPAMRARFMPGQAASSNRVPAPPSTTPPSTARLCPVT